MAISIPAGFLDWVLQQREVAKYHILFYVLNYVHIACTARKPNLVHGNSRQLIRKCSVLVNYAKAYHPTWYLLNNEHLHTITVALSKQCPGIVYEREIFHLQDCLLGLGQVVAPNALASPRTRPSHRPTMYDGNIPFSFVVTSFSQNYICVTVDKPRLLYNGPMTAGLFSLFFDRSNAHKQFVNYPTIDVEKIRSCTIPAEFDETLTRRIFGYVSVSDFYRDASCAQYMKNVCIPLLCLSAKDDPICIDRSTPAPPTTTSYSPWPPPVATWAFTLAAASSNPPTNGRLVSLLSFAT
ncbi:Aste57867_24791 [Aphanomyces stellatus]|uniref:Aste57867_24791 protein n=1 Tax=Aphanomyces stellatus TaxID=120398 RepID=A0A485LRF0_9STRA|nr:hypothetical protein As57867_024713 [Aphanomyces stellatus]VFU01426.1 Aste57867_24791 [Aphanomyces stellatus]